MKFTSFDIQQAHDQLVVFFPNLAFDQDFKITSPYTANKLYNCIAWAAGDVKNWWWPTTADVTASFWPEGAPRLNTLEAFEAAFQTIGYERCGDGSHEIAFEKVAIYAKGGQPTHASRQLRNGIWTSKCGESWDCTHGLNGVDGDHYGEIAFFMKRDWVATSNNWKYDWSNINNQPNINISLTIEKEVKPDEIVVLKIEGGGCYIAFICDECDGTTRWVGFDASDRKIDKIITRKISVGAFSNANDLIVLDKVTNSFAVHAKGVVRSQLDPQLIPPPSVMLEWLPRPLHYSSRSTSNTM